MELMSVLHLIEFVFWSYIALSVLYLLFFSIAGLFPWSFGKTTYKRTRKIAVLIPGYKEDAVILHTAQEALKQDYPKEYYDVVIIADSFKPETIRHLNELPIKVIEVQFEKSTKAKALNKAMEILGDSYDIALVLDADNIMEPNFLTQINDAFNRGHFIVQGHRIAKNTNTPFAVLDAVSEEINNTIFRKAHRSVNLSAALIGSGMAFDYALFKSTMKDIKAIGGFDKELEMFFLRHRYTIEYLPNAYVFDEKTAKEEVFSNQRKRWLSAQFIYFFRNLIPASLHLFKGNIDYFDKMIQMGQLPRVLLLGITFLFTFLYTILLFMVPSEHVYLQCILWYITVVALVFSLGLSIPKKLYSRKTLHAILYLPKGIVLMFLALITSKHANKSFIHTTHEIINTEK